MTGRSRGFGFVTYTSSEEASSAKQAMDGQVYAYMLNTILSFLGDALIFQYVYNSQMNLKREKVFPVVFSCRVCIYICNYGLKILFVKSGINNPVLFLNNLNFHV